MYINDEASGALMFIVDGVELVITPAFIAEVLHCSMDTTNAEQFPVFTQELTVLALVIEFYEGRQDDDNRTSICRANLPRCLIFLDVVLKKNVIPLGYKEKRRGDFLRALHQFDFGFLVDISILIFNQMTRILNEVKLRNTRGGSTLALPFANLIATLIKGQKTYPLEPTEVQLSPPTLYGKTQWRLITTLLPPPLLIPDAPTNPNDVLVEPAAAPAPPSFRITRAQYQALLDNQAAI
ncbi:unnamed protein product [Camellia sinensis]